MPSDFQAFSVCACYLYKNVVDDDDDDESGLGGCYVSNYVVREIKLSS